MRSNAGMANRQGDVDVPQLAPGLAWVGSAWLVSVQGQSDSHCSRHLHLFHCLSKLNGADLGHHICH
jgi:hypothetical protein